ncbi:MAG: hypothetical protein RL434_707 [Pseudomonadota bacterium]
MSIPSPLSVSAGFLGWRVVGAAFAVMFFAYGLQFSFGVIATGMGEDLGWSRAQTALPYSLYVFLYSALSAVTGHATDRFGPRAVIGAGALLIGIGWGGSALVSQPWHLTLSLGLVAAIGMSVAWVPCNATVARWFTRRRGTAVALASTGASLGNFLGPALTAVMMQAWGWRVALATLAIVSALAILVASRFMLRDPESFGQWPDGDEVSPAPHLLGGGLRVGDLWGDLRFQLVILIYFFTWLAIFVPFMHAPSHARDLGLGDFVGASLLSAIGIGGMAGRLFTGSISDRFGRAPTLLAICLLQAVSFLLFAGLREKSGLWLAALVFGVSYGGGVVLLPALCGDLFGRAHVASVVGVIFAVAGAPAAFGPWFAGWLYDLSGHYQGAFLFSAAVNGCAFLGTLLLAWHLRQRRLRDAI